MYDGIADWYERWIDGGGDAAQGATWRLTKDLLGNGPGRLVEIGCGGGRLIPLLAELGWTVIGVDESADQLRVAADRADAAALVHADATALPFDDDSFDAAVAVLVSTDVEPWETAVHEAARVLRPSGRFVHVGLHPCFVGPHAVLREEDGRRIVGPGYRVRERQFDLPAFRPGGIREKIGAVHVPLDELLSALLDAGLVVDAARESSEEPPLYFGVRARKPSRDAA
jgi:SAM-dependent methyltransferase